MRWLRGLAVAAFLAALVGGSTTDAAANGKRFVSGWIPYYATSASLAQFAPNADLFSDVSPFWHTLVDDSTVRDQATAANRSTVMASARSAGVPVIASVTDGTGTGYLAAALADPERRSKVVATLAELTATRGYDGLDLDLEGFAYHDAKSTWATTRPNWVAFVAELGARLRSQGKKLYATIPPTYDSNRSSTSGYWVYDYAGIAPHVDRIRIMAYDYSVGSPGPIAPFGWVERIVKYAQTQVPRSKLVLGIPAYGRDWVTSVSGQCPEPAPRTTALSQPAAAQLAASKRAAVSWDVAAGERTFTYSEDLSDGTRSCTVQRRVWYSDSRAVTDRAWLARNNDWAGVAVWQLGQTDESSWQGLRSAAERRGLPLRAGDVLEIRVPAEAKAVQLNLTATGPASAGFLTAYPCGSTRPGTSNLNYRSGETIANAVTVAAHQGSVCVFSSATTHVVADLSGYFPSGSSYQPATPRRLLDTRRSGARVPAWSEVRVAVPTGGGPAALSVVATDPQAPGWLAVYPCGMGFPGTSTMNFEAGRTIAGSAIASPGPDGTVCVRVSATTHVIVDLMGQHGPNVTTKPARLADSRASRPLAPFEERSVAAPAVGALNLTVTEPRAAGWLSVYPCGREPAATTSLNFGAGQTIANTAVVAAGANGRVCMRSNVETHLVVDRVASLGANSAYFTPVGPTRVIDTRRP